METILLIVLVGVLMLLAFLVGASISQKAYKDEKINIPNLNPIKAVENHIEKIKENKEQEEINTMLENINNYRGDSIGQKEIK